MIHRDAKPISHRPIYKRIDLSRPKRKMTVTIAEVEAGEREPDLEYYTFVYGFGWIKK